MVLAPRMVYALLARLARAPELPGFPSYNSRMRRASFPAKAEPWKLQPRRFPAPSLVLAFLA
jgi:hypothetical protein